MNVGDMFKKAAKATSSTKKGAIPEFQEPALGKAISLFLDAKQKEKEAKAQIMLSEATLLPRAAELHRTVCQNSSDYFSSVKLCSDDSNVTVSFPNKYSKIPSEKEESLREIFSKDYDKWFTEKTIASLSDVAMADEEFIKTIIEAIGADKFSLYFKVEQFIIPKDGYHEARSKDKSLGALHDAANKAGLVSPVKSSVKAG